MVPTGPARQPGRHRATPPAGLPVLFGGALAGGLPDAPTGAVAGFACLFLARPAAGLAGLAGAPQPLREGVAIACFGIRGLGSFYGLAYAANRVPLPEAEGLWAVAGFTVLVSIMPHGVTPAMRWLDLRRAQGGAESEAPLCAPMTAGAPALPPPQVWIAAPPSGRSAAAWCRRRIHAAGHSCPRRGRPRAARYRRADVLFLPTGTVPRSARSADGVTTARQTP
ncbi:hypothetical protein E2C05_16935 [Paracraurococcus ruber]|uniref:Cation/H+ exchanger domain-containing protein n=2 Tax=Paracraurococcus ruber TaxID=77675 RepID=A0ABS1D1X5_9PROT|nr:hypothetical protein [Paracraurococcus ruber]TDG29744.1 hypothetical protein E2C05_16935 [Paracraurococcus ruber]